MSNLLDAILRRLGGLFDAAEEALDVWDDLMADDPRVTGVDWSRQEQITTS